MLFFAMDTCARARNAVKDLPCAMAVLAPNDNPVELSDDMHCLALPCLALP
jgi:hypothetical protein